MLRNLLSDFTRCRVRTSRHRPKLRVRHYLDPIHNGPMQANPNAILERTWIFVTSLQHVPQNHRESLFHVEVDARNFNESPSRRRFLLALPITLTLYALISVTFPIQDFHSRQWARPHVSSCRQSSTTSPLEITQR